MLLNHRSKHGIHFYVALYMTKIGTNTLTLHLICRDIPCEGVTRFEVRTECDILNEKFSIIIQCDKGK